MIYVDSSALVSLYFRDANTAAAIALVSGAKSSLLVSSLGETEAVNAFCLRVFRKEMSRANAARAIRDLDADFRANVFDLRPFPQEAFTRAGQFAPSLTPRIGVRTADLLHVAAAIELGARTIYSFDLRQREAAHATGLKLNPIP